MDNLSYLPKSLYSILENLYNKNKNDILCIYQIGFCMFTQSLSDAHDCDILIVVKSAEFKNKLRLELKQIEFSDIRIDFHIWELNSFIDYYYTKDKIKPESFLIHYQFLNNPLFGDLRLPDYDILKCKKEYIDTLIKYYPKDIKIKRFYYLVAGLFILKNNSYKFTKYQYRLIIKAHNCCLTEKEVIKINNIYKATITNKS